LIEAQVSKIKKAAMDQATSVAEVIRRAVENMVQSSPKMTIQERARRAMEIVGKFRSGKKNISGTHDKYLANAYEK
jgi:Mg2+ and Co2+ transporter CorA